MPRHQQIAGEIHRLIRKHRLRPGDALPSERELARRFQVSLNTVRYANDVLCREGILHRRHGQGTFLAEPKKGRDPRQLLRRLGLLHVDAPGPVSPYSQSLTFAVQQSAVRAGYELLIERMQTADLLQGKIPEMVRRHSVDAVLLNNFVRDYHIRFLEDHRMLALVVGVRPLGDDVPQVRLNGYRLAYEITRELLCAGRHPVWLDVDVTRLEHYHLGVELLRGYEQAIQQYGGGTHSPQLCPIKADGLTAAVNKLVQGGLDNAAILAENWSSSLLPAALSLKSPRAERLLIVPYPSGNLCRSIRGPNVIEWSRVVEVEEIADRAVNTLIPVVEGQTEQLRTVSLEMSCRFIPSGGTARMELSCEWESRDAFLVERYGNGMISRHLGVPEGSQEVGISDSPKDNGSRERFHAPTAGGFRTH